MGKDTNSAEIGDAAIAASRNNKMIKKKRVMRYFMDATSKIINDEGVGNVTIRNVAALAGYNSGSLYNYFENIEELLAFSCIDMIAGWITDMIRLIDGEGDELDKYILGWKSHCLHSFQNPSAFAYIYSSNRSFDIFKYFKGYYEMFSEAYDNMPYTLVKMYHATTLRGQEEATIEACVKDGYFRKKDAKIIYNKGHLLYTGLLWRAIHSGSREHYREYTDIFLQYFTEHIQFWLQKKKDLTMYQTGAYDALGI